MDMNGGQGQVQMQGMHGGPQQQFQQYQQPPQQQQLNMMQNQQMAMMQQQQMMAPGQMLMGGPGAPPQMGGGYGFAARPKVLKRKQYRDPYREYIKVAPQNIMYDRRVVRGNTFAALVIPVNMQPDPALIEKQRMEEAYMKQRQEEMRMRRQAQERQREREREEERDQNMQMQQMTRANNWEELSDRDGYIPETDIQPDYYIDRPPTAVFIPNPKGEMKATQIFEGDPDLFDYENEVEPILQVLVGKSIEHARIEVIEEYEDNILKKHKSEYQQVREAELMETQRLEEVRARRNDEIDRRNMQMRIAKSQNQLTEKKLIARTYAKCFLSTFKRDTLLKMVDLGTLRRPVDLSTGTTFVPQLYNQIRADMQAFNDHQEEIDDFLGESMRNIAISHKQSIVKELNKRQEKKKEELRKKKEEEDARKRRKDKRAALRERDRISKLKNQIVDSIITPAVQEDYTTKMKIYDVRDPATTNDGIVLIGGFVGEMIISFTCLLDYILASPQHQNFVFTGEMIEQFLTDLLNDEWADGICSLHINKTMDEITQGRVLAPSQIAKLVKEKQNMSDFGLRYMFEIQKDLVLVPDVVDVIYTSICKMATKKPIEIEVIPEAPNEGEEQGDFDERVNKIKENNANAEIENAKYAKLQTKICINTRDEDAYNEDAEKALVKLNNWRETIVDENGNVLSARTQPAEEEEEGEANQPPQFNPERIPPKILITSNKIGDSGDLVALFHPEAAYSLRKVIMEHARKQFKELEKVEISQLLLHSNQRSTMLENKFEEKFIKAHNYERGCQYNDPIKRITFKTFLKD